MVDTRETHTTPKDGGRVVSAPQYRPEAIALNARLDSLGNILSNLTLEQADAYDKAAKKWTWEKLKQAGGFLHDLDTQTVDPMDVLRGTGSGLRTAATATAGLPGDILDWGQIGRDMLMQRMGLSPNAAEWMNQAGRTISPLTAALPTSPQINKYVTSKIGEPYEPQSAAGQLFNTGASLLDPQSVLPGGWGFDAANAALRTTRRF